MQAISLDAPGKVIRYCRVFGLSTRRGQHGDTRTRSKSFSRAWSPTGS